MNAITTIFENYAANEERVREIEQMAEPATKYVIAITPLSGSSYLCDVMKNTKLFGSPDEHLER